MTIHDTHLIQGKFRNKCELLTLKLWRNSQYYCFISYIEVGARRFPSYRYALLTREPSDEDTHCPPRPIRLDYSLDKRRNFAPRNSQELVDRGPVQWQMRWVPMFVGREELNRGLFDFQKEASKICPATFEVWKVLRSQEENLSTKHGRGEQQETIRSTQRDKQAAVVQNISSLFSVNLSLAQSWIVRGGVFK